MRASESKGRQGLALAVLLTSAVVFSAAAFAAAFPALLRIPARDSGRDGSTRSLPQAEFSHRAHQAFGCFSCHPAVFPQAPLSFTHDDMRQGRYCGRCHDGGVAFAIQGAACTGCHAPTR